MRCGLVGDRFGSGRGHRDVCTPEGGEKWGIKLVVGSGNLAINGLPMRADECAWHVNRRRGMENTDTNWVLATYKIGRK